MRTAISNNNKLDLTNLTDTGNNNGGVTMSRATEANYIKLAIDTVSEFAEKRYEQYEDQITDMSNNALLFLVDVYEKVEEKVNPVIETIAGMLNLPQKQEVEELADSVKALEKKVAELNKKMG